MITTNVRVAVFALPCSAAISPNDVPVYSGTALEHRLLTRWALTCARHCAAQHESSVVVRSTEERLDGAGPRKKMPMPGCGCSEHESAIDRMCLSCGVSAVGRSELALAS